MRRNCPFLLGALLIALICLSGGLQPLDRLLGPTTAWIDGWLSGGSVANESASPPMLASRELAPLAAFLCLALAPLFHRWSRLSGGLLVAGASAMVLLGTAVAGYAGTAVAPGALLAAILLALLVGTLARLESAAESRAHHGDPEFAPSCRLWPSTAPPRS